MDQTQAVAHGHQIVDGPYIETAVAPLEAQRLRELATGARRVLEIGTAFGYSTIVMALAGPDVTAVDPHTEFWSLDVAKSNFAAYGVAGRIKVVQKTSGEVLPEMVLKRRRFGLVFVDADHSEEAVAYDAEWGWKLVRKGGYMACHDYRGLPTVTAGLDRVFPDGPDEVVHHLWVKRK